MKKILISIGFLICVCAAAWSQLAIGKWRTHLAYNNVSQIAQSENKVFAVSEGALYSIDKLDKNIEFYSKLSGLNGSNITKIEYDATNKLLMLIYANGNIDVMSNAGITNIPDFYNKLMSNDKRVNHIFFEGNIAYLSCNFGILALNLQKKEVADTYIIGPNATDVDVLATTIYNDSIYSVTANALFRASSKEPNLVNYEFWSTVANLPGSGYFQSVIAYAGKLILLRGEKLYIKDGSQVWQAFRPELSFSGVNVSNGKLNLFSWNNLFLVDDQFNVVDLLDFATIKDAEYDATNRTYWFAGDEKGVISYNMQNPTNPLVDYFKPAGPALNNPYDMTFSGNRLFVVPGGRWGSQDGRTGVIMIYEDGQWSNILESDITGFTNHRALDFMNVAVDPKDNKHFFVTSYGTGLYEFKDDKITNWYTHTTPKSTLQTAVPTEAEAYYFIRIDGAIYDAQGNLWMDNIGKFRILKADGTWESIYHPTLDKPTLGKILMLSQNQNIKWTLSVRYTPGICVLDDNGTISDQSDDKPIFHSIFPDLDNEGQKISPLVYFSMAQDNKGVVWVGTEQGPLLFNNPTNAFSADFTCNRVKIPRADSTGLADYLLENEKIRAIAVDGANRKWLGTESSGVYLMSENGQETIEHFTMLNSPLLSNNILSIAINPLSGEVFFGTSQGIVSYQSNASVAEESFKNVHAYPNPVREDYTGVITITGLVEDTQVKITDLKGNLVCETVSNGSLATWDGKDIHGRKVSTGIYLAICVSPDGSQSTITKILVVN